MAKKKLPVNLGKLEIQIMYILRDRDEASVRDVFRILNAKREVAYTTILTTMQKLEKKGFLIHRLEKRKYIYRTLIRKDETESSLVDIVFMGAHSQVVTALVKDNNITVDQLKKLIKGLDKQEYG